MDFRDPEALATHFFDHGGEFGVQGEEAYRLLAEGFLSKAVIIPIMECTRRDGDRVRFDSTTNEFGVVTASGIIRTYFKPVPCSQLTPVLAATMRCHKLPTNLDYFRQSCG